MSSPGRPQKWQGWKTTSLMLFEEYRDVYEKIREMARREGKNFSELVAQALAEYVEKKYPGNPQAPLMCFDQEDPEQLPRSIQARLLIKDLEAAITTYKKMIQEIEQRGIREQWEVRDQFLDSRKKEAIKEIKRLLPQARTLSRQIHKQKFTDLFSEIDDMLE